MKNSAPFEMGSSSSSGGGGSQSRPMIYDAKLLQPRKKQKRKKRKEKEQLQRAANGVAGQARPANSPKPAVYRNNNNKCPMQFEF